MARFVNPVPQFGDDSLDPLIEGKLFFFESGSATLKDIFSDVNESIALANPVILSGSGRVPNIFFSGSARVKLTDSDDVQIFDRDPVGGESGAGNNFSNWNSLTIYSIPDYVIATDDNIYRSSINANQDNDPVSSPSSWEQVEFIGIFNLNITYAINDTVKASDGNLYRSIAGGNVGNDPISTDDWTAAVNITGSTLARTYASALSF